MFISSARVRLRSSADDEEKLQAMVGNERRSSDRTSWTSDGMVENDNGADANSFYPSVAQRIAVWRNLTTNEPGHAMSECDSVVDHSATTMTQGESPVSTTNGQHIENRISDDSGQSFVDHLMGELTSSRKRNKKLALKLANVERQVQQVQIEQRLRDDRLEAMVASRVADALSALMVDRLSESVETAKLIPVSQDITDEKITQLESGGDDKLASLGDCQSILAYIRAHGCQLPVLESDNRDNVDDVRPSSTTTKPHMRDIGTDARKCDDEVEKEEEDAGNHQLEQALSNANRELIIENAKLQEKLEESESNNRRVEDESSRLRVELENLKNRNAAAMEGENARLSSDVDKLKRRYEQAEAKWEREAYELRSKYQSADEENFRLAEELQALRRQLSQHAADSSREEELANVNERIKALADENKHLLAKNEELKRLVTVLRRKLSAVNGANGATTSK